jgi:hypothetical protein
MSHELKIKLLNQPRVVGQLGRSMSLQWGAEQILLYAAALGEALEKCDPTIAEIVEPMAIERFNGAFTVGMNLNHAEVMQQSVERATELAIALGLIEAPKTEEVTVVVPDQVPEPDKAEGNAPNADGPNKPSDYTATPIDSLSIHGTAKKAYKQAGLLTVGDLEAFAASRNLADVKGVAEGWAADTLEAIKTLKGE